MKNFYSVNQVTKTKRGSLYTVELEPQEKISIGEEVLIDGERKVVVGVSAWGSDAAKHGGTPKVGTREVGVFARDIVARVG